MTDILVVRHAESVWNSEGRWQGHADPPLSPAGEFQARAVCGAPGEISGIVSSDLSRARATAAILAEALDTGPVVLDAGWRERSVGAWQGLTTAEIQRDYPGALDAGRYPQGWEGDESLVDRVFSAIHRVAGQYQSGNVVAVSHAGIIYAIERHFGCSFERIRNLHGRLVRVVSGDMRLGERIALIDDGARLTSATSMEQR